MEVQIRNLNVGTYDAIKEVLGKCFREVAPYYVDGIEVCDVDVDVESVTLETAVDGVWLKKGDLVFQLEREDYLEIVIF